MSDPFENPTRESDASRYFKGRRMFAGRYTLIKPLGRGGMGEVWLAQDNELTVSRALKFAPPEVAADLKSVAMLKREAIAGTSLAHANIVRIFDFVSDPAERESAVVMEAVEGRTLSELQAQRIEDTGIGFFEPAEIEPWLREAAAALDYAHGEGRAHRDLKPQNFMIETATGRLKIMDFGICRRIGDSFSQLTGKDSSGTLPYMSPQQVMGEPPTAADDIYGLGATLYDLLTGGPPFSGGSIEAQIEKKSPPAMMPRRAEAWETIGEPVPEAWESAILQCLAKNRATRPVKAAGILDAIAELAARKTRQEEEKKATDEAKQKELALLVAEFQTAAARKVATPDEKRHHQTSGAEAKHLQNSSPQQEGAAQTPNLSLSSQATKTYEAPDLTKINGEEDVTITKRKQRGVSRFRFTLLLFMIGICSGVWGAWGLWKMNLAQIRPPSPTPLRVTLLPPPSNIKGRSGNGRGD